MARSSLFLLGGAAGLIALVPAAASAQQAPSRVLSWPGKPDGSAQPYAQQHYNQTGLPAAAGHSGAYGYSSGPRPAFTQPAPVAAQPASRGLTPASAWTGGQPLYYAYRDAGPATTYSPPAPSYNAPPPTAYRSAPVEAMPVPRETPAPEYAPAPSVYGPPQPQPAPLPRRVEAPPPRAPAYQPPVYQPPVEQPSAHVDAQGYWQGPAANQPPAPVEAYAAPQPQPQPAPATEPAFDPMAPRRDAPIFQMGRRAEPSAPEAPSAMPGPQAPAVVPQGPSEQPSAYQPAPVASSGGARYYSVHRDAGRHPDPVAMPQPTVVTLMAGSESTATAPGSGGVDLAEPQAPPALIRDVNGNLRAAPQVEDPSLP